MDTNSNQKIGVIGEKDSVMGFVTLGLSVVFASDDKQASSALSSMAKEGYAVIYMTETLAQDILDEIDRYKDGITPAIILIPSTKGSVGLGMLNVKRSVERAVGADILFNE